MQKTEPDAAAPPNERADLVAKPLIVIDNDLGVLEAMQALLSRWGADVHLARDLEDVAEILSDPAFVPARNIGVRAAPVKIGGQAEYHLDSGLLGIEAVDRIRHKVGREVPAILITADRTETTAQMAVKFNCELLHKPIRPAELRALMQHLLT